MGPTADTGDDDAIAGGSGGDARRVRRGRCTGGSASPRGPGSTRATTYAPLPRRIEEVGYTCEHNPVRFFEDVKAKQERCAP